MAFKGGNVLGTVSFNATGSGTTAIGATSNSGTISIGNTSSGAVNIDCGTAGINVGTTANAHTTTLGSTNSTSATTVQCGSGALNITSSNGAITMNSGTGTVAIGNDATGATYNFATGAGAKVVTLGSTNGASSLALKTGTADFSLASATGTIMSALDTGEITYPLQPAFFAYLASSTANNVTGDGTIYTIIYDTELFDQNSDFNTGTGNFTAPVTGKYLLVGTYMTTNSVGAQTTGQLQIITTANTFEPPYDNPTTGKSVGNFYGKTVSVVCPMTAGDTAHVTALLSGSTKTVGIFGSVTYTNFSGLLVC